MGQWMVRMGESMLKSKPVRKHFTRVLRKTLIAQCRIRGAEVKIRVEGGLMFVSGEEDAEINDALKHTFGVYAVDPFTEVEPTPEGVANAALQSNPEAALPFDASGMVTKENGPVNNSPVQSALPCLRKWTSQ